MIQAIKDMFRGYSEQDRLNAMEKVYDQMPEGGTIIYLTAREFRAYLDLNNLSRKNSAVFERNYQGFLFEIRAKKPKL